MHVYHVYYSNPLAAAQNKILLVEMRRTTPIPDKELKAYCKDVFKNPANGAALTDGLLSTVELKGKDLEDVEKNKAAGPRKSDKSFGQTWGQWKSIMEVHNPKMFQVNQ